MEKPQQHQYITTTYIANGLREHELDLGVRAVRKDKNHAARRKQQPSVINAKRLNQEVNALLEDFDTKLDINKFLRELIEAYILQARNLRILK